MKSLWAPWRIEYILGKKPEGCVFCTMPNKKDEINDRKHHILYRGEHNYIVMNLFPYNGGHVMVVPYVHTSTLNGDTLSKECLSEMMQLVKLSTECLSKILRPEGFNTGLNIGRAAGAGIKEHLHMHVVPRWSGDSNFMAVTDDMKIIPEHLDATYDKLLLVFKRMGDKR